MNLEGVAPAVVVVWTQNTPRHARRVYIETAGGSRDEGLSRDRRLLLWEEFSIDIIAADDDDAWHRIYSNFGSRHGVPRRFINVDSLVEIDPSDSTAPVVVAHFRDITTSEEE